MLCKQNVMLSCNYMIWLHLSMSEDVIFREERWLTRVLCELVNPINQHFLVILFIKHYHKSLTLHELFIGNNIRKACQSEFVNLWINTGTIINDFSIFFANSNLSVTNSSIPLSQYHNTQSYFLQWIMMNTLIFNLLYAWLLCLFTDVICIFIKDFNDLNDVINHF